MNYAQAAAEVLSEVVAARRKHPPMNSGHEGYAVILEELDELWDLVKGQTLDLAEARKEARQVAAMAIAFMVEVCQ